jgi:ABC-type transport system involved in multi-copper enzyme maturation permease subunit
MALLTLLAVGIVLTLAQLLAALPWMAVAFPELFAGRRLELRRLGLGLLAGVGGGVVLAGFLILIQNPDRLQFWGRIYGSLLHVQLSVDGFVMLFALLLRVWPKGGAVALAAFREGVRQPLFWLLTAAAIFLLFLSFFVPYFTLFPGDELKMMKQLDYDILMLAAVAFGVIAAGTSISEEIEGRTAVTLMSKPVSRRQFLLGKFAGILLAAGALTAIGGWCLNWALYAKPLFELDFIPDELAAQLQPGLVTALERWTPAGEGVSFVQGIGLWFGDVLAAGPGLVISMCQVMVLLAIAVALATRLPMMVNLVICLVIFFLGHLAPVLVQMSETWLHREPGAVRYQMLHFVAQLFDTFLPALDFFNLGPAILRDTPLEAGAFALYVGSVLLYAVLYSAIALLFGLILFEDRDLA